MRGLIELLTIFDWITPTIGFFEDIIYDPNPLHANSWVFSIPYQESLSSGWNAFMIEQMLSEHGIKYWGSQITNGKYFFSVPKNQARWAEYLITGSGIPVDPRSLGAPAPAPAQATKSKRAKPPAGPKRGFFDEMDAFLSKWLG